MTTGLEKEFTDALTAVSTPFRSIKTSELQVQFSMDPSFGLSRTQYGWYSNETLFDGTHFSDENGFIGMETSATTDDVARLRSAYPGRYVSHTLAEPGLGMQIPEEYLEYDENDRVSLTHGEITAGLIEVDEAQDSGVNTIAFTFESDGVYAQVRRNNMDVAKVRQEDWNIDPLDGSGPSGQVLRPEEGYIYNFPFTWYGFGAIFFGFVDAQNENFVPCHKVKVEGNVSVGTPNMPVEVAVQNGGTAQPLGVKAGGMQFATHGASPDSAGTARKTEIARTTGSSYISDTAVTDGNQIDPFAEPGAPLVSVRRDLSDVDSRVSLSVDVTDFFINVQSNCWVFIFDEYDDASALTGENFEPPKTIGNPPESRVEVDTSATDYTPSANVSFRGMTFVQASNSSKQTLGISGDQSARLPLEATAVVTAVTAEGSNSTGANPFFIELNEGF